jgi:hypothetical protein
LKSLTVTNAGGAPDVSSVQIDRASVFVSLMDTKSILLRRCER